jgi:hypothetical protein
MGNLSVEEQFIAEMKLDINITKTLPEELRNNKQFVLKALDACSEDAENYLKNFESNLLSYKKPIYLFKSYNIIFASLSDQLKDDKDIVLKVVHRYGDAIKHASERLRDDREVVLKAVQNHHNEFLLQYVSERLRNDEEIILESINNSEYGIEHASEEIRDNKQIALIALKTKGYIFKSLSERLRNDKELALLAIKSDSKAYWHFPSQLKSELTSNNRMQIADVIDYLEVINMKENLQKELIENDSKTKKMKI